MNYVISPFKMRGVKILKAFFWHTKRDPFIMPGISGGDGIAAGMTPPAQETEADSIQREVWNHTDLGGGLKDFLFSPLPGEDFPFD